jgi:hypothetical protein
VQPASAVDVVLCFGEEELELRLTARCQGPNGWPTDAMRERVALCDGELQDGAPTRMAGSSLRGCRADCKERSRERARVDRR